MAQALANVSHRQKVFATPEHILVATDLTDSEFLIPHAVAQARAAGARVTLVHAIMPSDSLAMEAGAVPYVVPSPLDRDVDQALAEMAGQITKEGVACDFVARHGFPADVVQGQIELTGATRLIMASHGRGKLGQFLMGSVANQLLGSLTIPAFVVGPQCSGSVQHAVPKNILHPVSMRGDYQASAAVAIAIARQFNAELTLLHVPDRDEERNIHAGHTIAWAENIFASIAPGGLPTEPRIHISIGFGNLIENIQHEAERTSADWVVMGIDEETHLWPLKESSAYRVMAHSRCPVFAIPQERSKAGAPEVVESRFQNVNEQILA